MVRKGYPDLLELTGAALVVAGVALWWVPLALIVAGLFLVAAANAVPPAREQAAVRRNPEARTGR